MYDYNKIQKMNTESFDVEGNLIITGDVLSDLKRLQSKKYITLVQAREMALFTAERCQERRKWQDTKDKNKRLRDCLDEIEAVSCGEDQVADDDSEGMGWIYKRIQTLKGK